MQTYSTIFHAHEVNIAHICILAELALTLHVLATSGAQIKYRTSEHSDALLRLFTFDGASPISRFLMVYFQND